MRRLVKTIKRYYDRGIYTKSDVGDFLEVGLITPAEYELIVGEPYTMGE